MSTTWTEIIKSHRAISLFFIFSILVFSFARLGYLSYADVGLNNSWQALFIGLRFDIKVSATLSLLMVLLGFLFLLNKKISTGYQRLLPFLLASLSSLIIFFAISNYFYLLTYNNYIDVFVFGLFDGNTQAILLSIWHDYPVIWFVASFLVVFFTSFFLYKRLILSSYENNSSFTKKIIYSFWVVLLLAVSSRGSLGTFPLRQNEVQVSDNQLLNASVPNGLMALYWANKDRKNTQTIKPVTEVDGYKLFQQFYTKTPQKNQPIFEQFFTKTPKNIFLEKNPPHVFLGIMESMSTHLLSLHHPPSVNVTGALQKHLENDFLFTRFLSSANGTEPSLAHLLFNSSMARISHSKYQKIKLATTIARPYKQAGYKTVYVTAGSGSWKNLGNYVLRQDFDKVVDQNTIKKWFPEATAQTWGVFDEWGFKAIEKILAESKQPVFVTFLSITNHPPFTVPDHYQAHPITLDAKLKKILKGFKDAKAALISFQYANDALGQFISNIKKSPIGGKTILAFTGEHNARSVSYPDIKNKAYYYSVPFLLSVPKKYKNNIHYNKLRTGSHKDIAPSLYQLSLSDTTYLNLGKSMLGADSPPHEFGINEKTLISNIGMYDPTTKQQSFWQGQSMLLENAYKAQDQQVANKFKIFFKIRNWLISWQLTLEAKQQPN